MLQLAEEVLKATGSDLELVYEELPDDDPKQRCPDITKAKDLLGWSPQVDLQTGLARTVDYYRQQLSEEIS